MSGSRGERAASLCKRVARCGLRTGGRSGSTVEQRGAFDGRCNCAGWRCERSSVTCGVLGVRVHPTSVLDKESDARGEQSAAQFELSIAQFELPTDQFEWPAGHWQRTNACFAADIAR